MSSLFRRWRSNVVSVGIKLFIRRINVDVLLLVMHVLFLKASHVILTEMIVTLDSSVLTNI